MVPVSVPGIVKGQVTAMDCLEVDSLDGGRLASA
jgi:hypothetical protein